VSAEKFPEGRRATEKRPKNSKKSPKHSTIEPLSGGEPTEKRPKNIKKTPKYNTF